MFLSPVPVPQWSSSATVPEIVADSPAGLIAETERVFAQTAPPSLPITPFYPCPRPATDTVKATAAATNTASSSASNSRGSSSGAIPVPGLTVAGAATLPAAFAALQRSLAASLKHEAAANASAHAGAGAGAGADSALGLTGDVTADSLRSLSSAVALATRSAENSSDAPTASSTDSKGARIADTRVVKSAIVTATLPSVPLAPALPAKTVIVPQPNAPTAFLHSSSSSRLTGSGTGSGSSGGAVLPSATTVTIALASATAPLPVSGVAGASSPGSPAVVSPSGNSAGSSASSSANAGLVHDPAAPPRLAPLAPLLLHRCPRSLKLLLKPAPDLLAPSFEVSRLARDVVPALTLAGTYIAGAPVPQGNYYSVAGSHGGNGGGNGSLLPGSAGTVLRPGQKVHVILSLTNPLPVPISVSLTPITVQEAFNSRPAAAVAAASANTGASAASAAAAGSSSGAAALASLASLPGLAGGGLLGSVGGEIAVTTLPAGVKTTLQTLLEPAPIGSHARRARATAATGVLHGVTAAAAVVDLDLPDLPVPVAGKDDVASEQYTAALAAGAPLDVPTLGSVAAHASSADAAGVLLQRLNATAVMIGVTPKTAGPVRVLLSLVCGVFSDEARELTEAAYVNTNVTVALCLGHCSNE